jgi:hypothetical protein
LKKAKKSTSQNSLNPLKRQKETSSFFPDRDQKGDEIKLTPSKKKPHSKD